MKAPTFLALAALAALALGPAWVDASAVGDRPAAGPGNAPSAAGGAAVGGGASAGGGAGPVLAGAAVRSIDPDLGAAAAPVYLAGAAEGRVATGRRDELSARAFVLEAGGGAVGLVVLDLYGLARDDVERIRASVRGRAPAIPLLGLLVACTRTHSAPDATGQFTPPGSGVDVVWLERVVRAAADAVEQAWRDRQPARLSFATARLPRLLSDARQPQRLDDQAALVRVERLEGRVGIATLAFFSGSPEALGRKGRLLSADYPGEARRALEDAFGGTALLVVGSPGGLMIPVSPKGASADAAAGVGGALARGLQVAWSGREEAREPKSSDLITGTVGYRVASVTVPVESAALREALATGRRRGHLDGAALVTEVAMVSLDSPAGRVLEIACVPGALYPELTNGGIQDPQEPAADRQGDPAEPSLRSLMRAPLRLVAGGCGDDLGDLIPGSQWDEKPPFAYGLPAAPRGEETSPGPRTAGLILRAFADLLR